MRVGRVLLVVQVLGVAFPLVQSSGCNVNGGFECGVETTSGSGTTVTKCDRDLEVCVCATHSCATRDTRPEPTRCDSNYRYVSAPFASDDWKGECVPKYHLQYGLADGKGTAPEACADLDGTGGGAGTTNDEEPASSGGATPDESGAENGGVQ